MSSYCDTCDNTMRETTAYLVGGERFNYCNECVEENGYQEGEKMIKNCVDSSEWEWKDCDLEGHDIECYRLVCPSCGDTMSRDCEDK
jgi:hypothetical protein